MLSKLEDAYYSYTEMWTVTYFSWRKVQKTQPYAVYMIDSVVNGSLFDVTEPEDPPMCARTGQC